MNDPNITSTRELQSFVCYASGIDQACRPTVTVIGSEHPFLNVLLETKDNIQAVTIALIVSFTIIRVAKVIVSAVLRNKRS